MTKQEGAYTSQREWIHITRTLNPFKSSFLISKMSSERHYICSYQNPDSSIKFFILSDYEFKENIGVYRFITSRERIGFWLNLEDEDGIKDTEKIFQHLLNETTKSQKEKFQNKSELEVLYESLKNQGVNQITYHKGSQMHVEIKHYYPPLKRRVFHDDNLEKEYRIKKFRERVITNTPRHQHPHQKQPYIFRQQY